MIIVCVQINLTRDKHLSFNSTIIMKQVLSFATSCAYTRSFAVNLALSRHLTSPPVQSPTTVEAFRPTTRQKWKLISLYHLIDSNLNLSNESRMVREQDSSTKKSTFTGLKLYSHIHQLRANCFGMQKNGFKILWKIYNPSYNFCDTLRTINRIF